MNAKAGTPPAPRKTPATSVALLRDVIGRLIAASEAIEDGDCRLAESIIGDLIDDVLGAASL
jgi:hypothetical protein